MNNITLKKTKDNRIAKGGWLSIGSSIIAEIASSYEFDWLLFDYEHGSSSESTLINNLQAAKKENLDLIVRVSHLNSALIARVLDWGADGIMLPHVNTAEQAKACINAMRFPPEGKRGFSSSTRAHGYGIKNNNSIAKRRDKPLFFAQIETCEGVINSEKIAEIPGVDVLFVGPRDLQIDYDLYGKALFSTIDDALKKVILSGKKYQKQIGILAKSPVNLYKYSQMGFTTIAYGSDISFLNEGFKKAISLFKEKVK